jgi:16S rRNA processing protein RimM
VRGEVRGSIITDHPELLSTHPEFFLSPPGNPEAGSSYAVERVRLHAGVAIFKLKGCDDRNAAEELRGMLVHVELERAVPLEDGEYYQHQVIGLTVETVDGERLGTLVEVLETGANDVYIVRGLSGEVLIPAVEDVVKEIDLVKGTMIIEPLPGLLRETNR